jgi:membrane protein required for colicin V production
MDGFTLVDGIVLAVIALSAVLAYARGLVRELLSIAGWVVAAIVAFLFAAAAEPLMREVPVLSDIIGSSCELGILAGFAAVFAVALVVVSLLTPVLSGAVQNSAVGPVDQGLGLLFGVARGVLLVVIALVVYERVLGGSGIAVVEDSRSRTVFSGLEEDVTGLLPADTPNWVVGRWGELSSGCS